MHPHEVVLPRAGEGQPRPEVADVFRAFGEAYRKSHSLSTEQRAAMHAIETCRTAVLGGHLDVCHQCGFQRPSYNSCRDRHCPKCQAIRQGQWIEDRMERILPTRHFHVVFTAPHELEQLARSAPETFFSLLFRAASQTLLELGADQKRLGALLGITAILHTWTRQLDFHPHLHCIVTAGGLAPDGKRWIPTQGEYLFPVKVMSRLFRGKLLAEVGAAWAKSELRSPNLTSVKDFNRFQNRLFKKEWVVYAKHEFRAETHMLKYLGRYVHRVGISNERMVSLDEQGVTFRTRGDNTATLAPEVFIQRFLQHVLPPRFVKTRHYGLYAAASVPSRLPTAAALLTSQRKISAPPRKLFFLALCILLFYVVATSLDRWRLQLILLFHKDPLACPRCGGTLTREPLPLDFAQPQVLDSS